MSLPTILKLQFLYFIVQKKSRVGKGDTPDTMGYAHGPPGSLTSFTDAGVCPEPAERDGQGVAGVELVTRSSSQSEKSTQGEMREREGDPTRRVLDFSSKGGRC